MRESLLRKETEEQYQSISILGEHNQDYFDSEPIVQFPRIRLSLAERVKTAILYSLSSCAYKLSSLRAKLPISEEKLYDIHVFRELMRPQLHAYKIAILEGRIDTAYIEFLQKPIQLEDDTYI